MSTTSRVAVFARCVAACVAVLLQLLYSGAVRAGDTRIKVVDFDPQTVIPLTGFVGYHIHLEFEPGEQFVNLGAGDLSVLEVGAEGSHLMIKPRAATSGTNLTILTNRRAYYLDYHALARSPRSDEATYSISFRYPRAASPVQAIASGALERSRLDEMPAATNRNYWYCGSPRLRPVAAADDGLQLQLTFRPDAELPTIYAVADDGSESVVNTHTERDTVFVHRLAKHFVLRRGREVGCVVDRSLQHSGRRASSGTVDGQTQRVLHTGEP